MFERSWGLAMPIRLVWIGIVALILLFWWGAYMLLT
jgi:hypothetical protein